MLHSLDKTALIFTGPAGVGKTTVSKYFIDQVLKEKPSQKIYYFQGDCFAHISCPWSASPAQLNLKYNALIHTLELFFSDEALYVVDDIFRRDQDLKYVLECFAAAGVNAQVIFLDADFKIVSQRNQERTSVSKIHELLMIELNASEEQANKCLSLASIREPSVDFAAKISQLGVSHPLLDEGIEELKNVMRTLSDLPSGKIYANLAIARGLNYYTGTVYEGKLTKFPDFPTIFAGGRYENLVGTYLNKKLPGVGISIGITRIFGKLLKEGLLDIDSQTPTEVLFIQTPESDLFELEQAAEQLRSRGICTEVYPDQTKIGKQIKYAERKGINYLIFVSESGGFEMKDVKTGKQIVIDFDSWLPPVRKYQLVPSNHKPFVKQ